MSFVFCALSRVLCRQAFRCKARFVGGHAKRREPPQRFRQAFCRFSEGKPCDTKQHDNINARQCNTSARDAEQLCKKVCKASAEKTSAAAQAAAFGPCMGNSLSEAHGGNRFCIFGKVNERKQRECGSGCANDRAPCGNCPFELR